MFDDDTDRVRVTANLAHGGIFGASVDGFELGHRDADALRYGLGIDVLGFAHGGERSQKLVVVGYESARAFAQMLVIGSTLSHVFSIDCCVFSLWYRGGIR